MALYPSLEDMKVDQMMKAQMPIQPTPTTPSNLPYPANPTPALPGHMLPNSAYPSLTSDTSMNHGSPTQNHTYPGLAEYMGLVLSPEEILLNMPEYLPSNQTTLALSGSGALSPVHSTRSLVPSNGAFVAPLSGSSLGLARAQVSHGIRQVILCKDQDGKVGMRVKAVNKGIFVCLVITGSPAAVGGLRFGDQILQVNGISVAGYSSDKVHDILKKAGDNNIVLAVRDRPFERTLTLHKDSSGHIGFQFKEGKITSITVDSSAARNGLLIDHNLLEVNGQNVVGVKDKETGRYIDEGGNIITVTIIPTYIYNHIMKNMSSSLVKKLMDHSVPDM